MDVAECRGVVVLVGARPSLFSYILHHHDEKGITRLERWATQCNKKRVIVFELPMRGRPQQTDKPMVHGWLCGNVMECATMHTHHGDHCSSTDLFLFSTLVTSNAQHVFWVPDCLRRCGFWFSSIPVAAHCRVPLCLTPMGESEREGLSILWPRQMSIMPNQLCLHPFSLL